MPEPWLRGERLDADPVIAPLLFALRQVREDLGAILIEDVWRSLPGIPALGFQLRHIAGSLDRLTTYLEGDQLSDAQLEELHAEQSPGPSRGELMALIETAMRRTEKALLALEPGMYPEPRHVGRQRIPTTTIGLAIHIAEHTQRHCGQAVTTAKLLNFLAAAGNSPAHL